MGAAPRAGFIGGGRSASDKVRGLHIRLTLSRLDKPGEVDKVLGGVTLDSS